MARGRTRNSWLATCPACGSEISFRRQPRRGQFVTCHDCDSLLEVLRLSPLKLEWAFEDPFDLAFSDSDRVGDSADDDRRAEDVLADWDYDDYVSHDAYADDDFGEYGNDRRGKRYS